MLQADVLDELAEMHLEMAALLRQRANERRNVDDTRPVELGDGDIVSRARAIHPQLGPRQAEIVTLLHEFGQAGTNTGVLSRRMSYSQSNVHLTLKEMIRSGLVERDADAHPHRYMLSHRLTDRW